MYLEDRSLDEKISWSLQLQLLISFIYHFLNTSAIQSALQKKKSAGGSADEGMFDHFFFRQTKSINSQSKEGLLDFTSLNGSFYLTSTHDL